MGMTFVHILLLYTPCNLLASFLSSMPSVFMRFREIDHKCVESSERIDHISIESSERNIMSCYMNSFT